MKKYKFLDHTADIKFQAFGKTIEKAFENSGKALIESLYDKRIKKKIYKKVKIKGNDFESLLYNFLEEFLVLFDSENFLVSKIKNININSEKFELEAEFIGDNAQNYEIKTSIKAVTYNEMFVKKEKNKYIVQVVLDI